MSLRLTAASLVLATSSLIVMTGNTHALTTKECSAKYKAAQEAGTLKGMKWNDFRKAECASEATAVPTAAPPGTTTTTAAPKAEKKEAVRPAPSAPAASAPAAT